MTHSQRAAAVLLVVTLLTAGAQPAGAAGRRHHHRHNHRAHTPPPVTPPPPTPPVGPPAPAQPAGPYNGTATLLATLVQPVAAVPVGGGLYVAEKTGKVVVLSGGAVTGTVLDISGLVSQAFDQGLLGIAVAGSHLYVDYTDTVGDIHVVEYTLTGDVAGSPRELLTQAHVDFPHDGGNLVFGPDGKLYIGVGDGDTVGDPHGNGQSLGTWLGKILRIEPTPSGGRPYTVPADNPFVGTAGAKPEIWAYGLRNPWRFSFDRSGGDLWIGDVGQDLWEEVDHATVGRGGQNYGWNLREGSHPYNGGALPPGAVDPVFEYGHTGGNCSITGGYVYRGSRISGIAGDYVFGDLCTGQVSVFWGFGARPLGPVVKDLVSFAEDAAGELYALSLDGGVYRIDPA
ncbi:MAG TPA: PQQ-dependent sugar dehydrogenase [Acidimicrobiales bacterium]|nr:PQQ-dependent sugar dehydrogenase [Acidimicrobiales bacterium]